MSSSKVLGIIYARYDSSRLPGKALRDVRGEPLIGYVLARARQIPNLSSLVLATSSRPIDSLLVEFANSRGLDVYRGDLEDVAGRTLGCTDYFGADYFVRINADSPWLDFNLIASAIEQCRREDRDFITNLRQRTYPYGISMEVVKTSAFARAYTQLTEPRQKEHITEYFYSHPASFDSADFSPASNNLSSLRMTVDNEADFEKFKSIVEILGENSTCVDYLTAAALYQQEVTLP